MDIDNKFGEQDKLISFLVNQINSMEVKMQSLQRSQSSIQDNERDARMKLESSLKYSTDNVCLSSLITLAGAVWRF